MSGDLHATRPIGGTAPELRVVPTLPEAMPVIRPSARATPFFDAQAGTTARIGNTVLTGLAGDPPEAADYEAAGACGVAELLRVPHLAIDARGLPAHAAAHLAAGACLRAWRYDALFTRPREDAPRLAAIDLVSGDPDTRVQWTRISAGVEGALFARTLVTEPANTLTPASFADHLAPLVAAGITLDIIDATALRRLGCGGLLAVGGGASHPPCLIVLRWPGAGAPVAFVGKAITFDTGGICIKPADRMWDMRADMAGAAACAGALLALARRRSPRAAMAVLAVAENTTGAASYRPGDVLRLFDTSTVAVVDTDAEGRLVLADALAWTATQTPAAIIDLATLTGSIVTALGHEHAGAFGTHDALFQAAAAAGLAVGEPIWRMPFTDADLRALDSDIADIRHCVDARFQPDASHAAAFLRRFVGDIPWLHLDIAGVEQREEPTPRHAACATGFGARLLDRLVADHFEPALG